MYKISDIETNIRNSCNVLITVNIETIVAGCFVHLVMNFGAFIDGESWGRIVGLPVLILHTNGDIPLSSRIHSTYRKYFACILG